MKNNEEMIEKLSESHLENLRITQKKTHIKLGKKIRKSITELSVEILSVYKSIKSIFDTKEPSENEVCLIMLLNKNEHFLSLYKPLIDIFCSDLLKPKYELSKINIDANKKQKNEKIDYMDYDEFNSILKEILSELNKSNENLIDAVLDKYIEIKNEKNLLLINSEDHNNIFYFEDFIFIFCSFIHYFTGFKIKLELSNDKEENIILFIYGENDKYESIAEFFGFELQIKPYAIKYEDYINRQNKSLNFGINKKNKKEEQIELEENLIINKDIKNPNTDLQFKDLNLNNKLGFPPYLPFDLNKKEKFRTYDKNDDYHFCENDTDFGNSKCFHDVSILRNIDKLRLIKLSLQDIFHFNDLYQYNFLKSILYKRNIVNYKDKQSIYSISYTFFSLLNNNKLMDVINTFRNFYSEYISYYFLWLVHLIHWMIYPIILGLILYSLLLSNYIKKMTVYNDNEIRIDLKDIILLGFSGLIIIMADLFQKTWIQKEKIYSYIWGMENLLNNEPNNDFKSDQSIDFLFGTKIKIMKKKKFIFRNIISYVILGIIIIIRIISIHFLFSLQRKWNEEYQTKGKLGYAMVSGGISLIMTQIYKFLSRKLSYWENHKNLIDQYNSLTLKVFLFEFFNNYGTILYIAFYKPYLDIIHITKKNNIGINDDNINYFSEMKIHLYVLLLINIGENLASFGMPLAYYLYQTRLKKNNKIMSNDKNYTIKYQMSCYKYDNLLIEYMQKIILFGYINLFLVAVPLCPIIILFILVLEYLLDSYKLVHFIYFMNIGGAKGIEVYNIIIKIISFIGIMSNGGLILFTKQCQDNNNTFRNFHFTELSGIMRSPIGIFVLFENIILLFMSFISIDIKPKWFRHLEKYKAIYIEKYFKREKKRLPHLLTFSKKLTLKF
jgi:hypothetical protein